MTRLLALLLAVAVAAPAAARDTLTIGVTQFPATLHPHIDAMVAKTYVLNAAMRPIATHDQNWELVCMLCTRLPTIENGLAVRETLDNGDTGIAVTWDIHPEATWGDGTPVTAHDVVFYLAGRAARNVGLRRHGRLPPHPRHRRDRRQDLHRPHRPGDLPV